MADYARRKKRHRTNQLVQQETSALNEQLYERKGGLMLSEIAKVDPSMHFRLSWSRTYTICLVSVSTTWEELG